MKLENIYKLLCEDPTEAFVQTTTGDYVSFLKWAVNYGGLNLHLYPGSFNPLHDAHREIYSIMSSDDELALFELSIHRFDKPELTLEDLRNRLAQFVDYAPVLITNSAKFSEKVGLIAKYFNVVMHVGQDTIQRLLIHSSKLEVQGLNCEFRIYNRIVGGNVPKRFTRHELPYNCHYGKDLPEELMKLSSTAIRNKC